MFAVRQVAETSRLILGRSLSRGVLLLAVALSTKQAAAAVPVGQSRQEISSSYSTSVESGGDRIALATGIFSYLNPVLTERSTSIATIQSGARILRERYRVDADIITSAYVTPTGLNRPAIWFEASELAWVSPRFARSEISLGRRRVIWSPMDESWGLGIWQPRNRWDYLRVSQVALTGLTYRWRSGDAGAGIQFLAFGSPLFIPERGPELSLRDGIFYPSNAWPGSPPRRAPLIGGVETDVRYQIAMPAMSKILLNPSAGAQLRAGSSETSSGPWGSLSYAFKPINQIAMAYDGYLNLAESRADAVIHPRVAYHQVGEIAVGHHDSRRSFWTALSRELPVLEAAPESWTAQTLPPSTFLGAGTTFRVGSRKIEGSYLRRFGDPAFDSGAQASPGKTAFEGRALFNHAVSASIQGPLPGLANHRFEGRAKLTYALDSEGTLIGAEAKYAPSAHWTLALGADILGSASSASQRLAPDFITRYRAHDRVYGGLSYVF